MGTLWQLITPSRLNLFRQLCECDRRWVCVLLLCGRVFSVLGVFTVEYQIHRQRLGIVKFECNNERCFCWAIDAIKVTWDDPKTSKSLMWLLSEIFYAFVKNLMDNKMICYISHLIWCKFLWINNVKFIYIFPKIMWKINIILFTNYIYLQKACW